MTWVGMPVDIVERLERLGLTRDDRLLYVEGFLYAGQYLTDGTVTARLPRLGDHPDADAAAARLVDAQVWEHIDDGAYVIVDYFTANLTREEVTRRKEDARLRQERSRRHKAGDHSICIRGRYCPDGQSETVTRDVTREITRESQDTYLPDLPDLQGKGREGKESAGDDGRGSPKGSPTPTSPTEQTTPPTPHIYTDTQRLGTCQHCNLPQRNATHHHGAPNILQHLAEVTADLGRLIPERSFDTTDHWWTAKVITDLTTWTWETEQVPLDQAEPQSMDWCDVKVQAYLPEDAWQTWEAELDSDRDVKAARLAWEPEGDKGVTYLALRAPDWPQKGGDVTHHLPALRRHVRHLLTFPAQVKP